MWLFKQQQEKISKLFFSFSLSLWSTTVLKRYKVLERMQTTTKTTNTTSANPETYIEKQQEEKSIASVPVLCFGPFFWPLLSPRYSQQHNLSLFLSLYTCTQQLQPQQQTTIQRSNKWKWSHSSQLHVYSFIASPKSKYITLFTAKTPHPFILSFCILHFAFSHLLTFSFHNNLLLHRFYLQNLRL